MLRRFLKEGLIYAVSNVLTRGIALLLVPLYTRVLGPSDLGALDLLTLLGNVANMVLVLEIAQAVARFYPTAGSQSEQSAYASTALGFTLAVYSFALALALAAATPLSRWIFEDEARPEVLWVALPALWTNGVLYFLQNQLRWQLLARAYALVSLTYALISAIVTVGLIVVGDLGVTAVFWGQMAGGGCACVHAFLATGGTLRLHFDVSRLREMLAFSAPLVISSAAALAAFYADRIVIKEFLTMSDLGIYSVAQRLAGAVSLVLVGFQSAITPLVTHFSKDAATPAQISRMLRYFLALAVPAVLCLGLFSRELLMLFATPIYFDAHALLPVLGAAVLLGGMYVFAPGLWLARRTHTIMRINLAAAAANILLNLLLVPRFGLAGAAEATCACGACAFAAYVLLGRPHFPVAVPWLRLTICSAMLVGALAVGGLFGAPSPVAVAGRAALFAGTAGAVVVILIGRAELRRLVARIPALTRHK